VAPTAFPEPGAGSPVRPGCLHAKAAASPTLGGS
jgi:hypothetical protein